VRAVFFGTPDLAVPSLRALAEVADVVGVVCQPDRARGRGLKLEPPPVKRAATELGLLIVQPEKVRDGALEAWLCERSADVALVIAYGRILPPAVLQAPRAGCLNIHASILPRYRGAAPIQRAIMGGETETGISLMQMDEGLDTGPVYATHRLSIGAAETAGELGDRLALLAAECIRKDLPRVLHGELTATPQDSALATHAPPIGSDDARLDWTRPAVELVNQARGLAPRPGAFTTLAGVRLKVLRALARLDAPALEPGRVGADHGRIWVGTGRGVLELELGQLEGKKALSARDLINGRALAAGDLLGT
jgi:methionyl-tRNA formyltransferase